MKTLNIFLAIIMAISTYSVSNAQNNSDLINETVKVWGNCGMCKARIEKAAKEAGAVTASWSDETKILSVSFASSKTSLNAIEEKIAAVGHDTQNAAASSDAYKKLPGCCKYERKTATNDNGAMASCCDNNTSCTGDACCHSMAVTEDCCTIASEKTAFCIKDKTCCSI